MKSVVIIGAGGFGREVLEIFKDQNKISPTWDILGFVDDNKSQGKLINDYPVVGGLDWLKQHNNENTYCVVAIGACETRKKIVVELEKHGVRFCNAIHPSVIMSEFVEMGQGVIIAAGSVITVNVKIGSHVHIDTNCSVAHDAVLGDYSRLNPGVRVNGNNKLGPGVHMGSGATMVHGTSIGEWSTIGAGAVVIRDIPEKVVAVGVPAKVIKHK